MLFVSVEVCFLLPNSIMLLARILVSNKPSLSLSESNSIDVVTVSFSLQSIVFLFFLCRGNVLQCVTLSLSRLKMSIKLCGLLFSFFNVLLAGVSLTGSTFGASITVGPRTVISLAKTDDVSLDAYPVLVSVLFEFRLVLLALLALHLFCLSSIETQFMPKLSLLVVSSILMTGFCLSKVEQTLLSSMLQVLLS